MVHFYSEVVHFVRKVVHFIGGVVHSSCEVVHYPKSCAFLLESRAFLREVVHFICKVVHSSCEVLHFICEVLHSSCEVLHSSFEVLHFIYKVLHNISQNSIKVPMITHKHLVQHRVIFSYPSSYGKQVILISSDSSLSTTYCSIQIPRLNIHALSSFILKFFTITNYTATPLQLHY